MTETGVIPVIRAASADEASRAIDALKAGGIDVFEITMTVPGAIQLIEKLAASYAAGDVLIGAGTVPDAQTAGECVSAGAQFIISPALNLDTILFCNQSEIVVMPGALTPTEIVTAWNAGADFVKVFPAGALGGASYLKSLKAPLPDIKLIPPGGVSLRTAADFIKAGASAIGVGADLVDLEALRNGRENLIAEKAREYLKIVKAARREAEARA